MLTSPGTSIVDSAITSARANLAKKLEHLSGDELEAISQAMQILRPIFINQNK
jgi:hypothetical protein